MSSLPRALLLDMDGTLVDTEPYWIDAERALVAEFGGSWTEEDGRSLVGFDLLDSARELQRRGGVRLERDAIVERLLDAVIERCRVALPWRPGAADLLDDARAAGVPTALVTMSWRRFADAVIAAAPPGSFATSVTGDEVREGKPHPEPYLSAAAALGVAPADCLAIEDSPTGTASALAAGCRTVAVPHVVDVAPRPGLAVVDTLAGWSVAALWERTLAATA